MTCRCSRPPGLRSFGAEVLARGEAGSGQTEDLVRQAGGKRWLRVEEGDDQRAVAGLGEEEEETEAARYL